MIRKIVCEKCQNAYRIDEDKIPITGARITCKNCGYKFAVYFDAGETTPIVDAVKSAPREIVHSETTHKIEKELITESDKQQNNEVQKQINEHFQSEKEQKHIPQSLPHAFDEPAEVASKSISQTVVDRDLVDFYQEQIVPRIDHHERQQFIIPEDKQSQSVLDSEITSKEEPIFEKKLIDKNLSKIVAPKKPYGLILGILIFSVAMGLIFSKELLKVDLFKGQQPNKEKAADLSVEKTLSSLEQDDINDHREIYDRVIKPKSGATGIFDERNPPKKLQVQHVLVLRILWRGAVFFEDKLHTQTLLEYCQLFTPSFLRDIEGLYALSACAMIQNDEVKFSQYLEKIFKLNFNDKVGLLLEGYQDLRSGQMDLAAESFKQVLAQDSKQIDAILGMYQIHKSSDKEDLRREYLLKALKIAPNMGKVQLTQLEFDFETLYAVRDFFPDLNQLYEKADHLSSKDLSRLQLLFAKEYQKNGEIKNAFSYLWSSYENYEDFDVGLKTAWLAHYLKQINQSNDMIKNLEMQLTVAKNNTTQHNESLTFLKMVNELSKNNLVSAIQLAKDYEKTKNYSRSLHGVLLGLIDESQNHKDVAYQKYLKASQTKPIFDVSIYLRDKMITQNMTLMKASQYWLNAQKTDHQEYANLLYADVLFRNEQYQKALPLYDKLLRTENIYLDVSYLSSQYAQTLIHLGDVAKGAKINISNYWIDENNPDSIIGYIDLCLLADDSKKANKILEFASQQFADNEHIQIRYASTLLRLNEIDKSQEILKKLIEKNAQLSDAYALMAQGYKDTDPQKALEHIEKATQLKPGIAAYFFLKGSILMALQKYSEAKNAWQSGIKLEPKNSESHLQLAKTLIALDMKTAAVKELREVILLAPYQISYYFELGQLLEDLSLPGQALQLYQQALKMHEDNEKLLRRVAFLYHENGYVKEAIKTFKRVLEVNQDDAKLHSILGDLYKEDHQNKEAIKQYGLYLKKNPTANDAHLIEQEIQNLNSQK